MWGERLGSPAGGPDGWQPLPPLSSPSPRQVSWAAHPELEGFILSPECRRGDILIQEEKGPCVTVYRPGVECDELSFLKWMSVLPGESVSRSLFLPRLLSRSPSLSPFNLHTAFS